MSKALPEDNKTFMTSSCNLGCIRVEKSRKSELLCFLSDLLEI